MRACKHANNRAGDLGRMREDAGATTPASSRVRACRCARRGYTLFEMVLVLAVLVILAAVAVPSLEAMYGNFRLSAAADMVRANWAAARAHAVEEGRPYRFAVVPNHGNFRVAPDSANFWSGGDVPASSGGPDAPLVLEDVLPKGVRFTTPDALQSGTVDQSGDSALPTGSVDSSQWSRTVTFLPDGTSLEDVEMGFHTRGGQPLILRLRALTGVVTLKSSAQR